MCEGLNPPPPLPAFFGSVAVTTSRKPSSHLHHSHTTYHKPLPHHTLTPTIPLNSPLHHTPSHTTYRKPLQTQPMPATCHSTHTPQTLTTPTSQPHHIPTLPTPPTPQPYPYPSTIDTERF